MRWFLGHSGGEILSVSAHSGVDDSESALLCFLDSCVCWKIHWCVFPLHESLGSVAVRSFRGQRHIGLKSTGRVASQRRGRRRSARGSYPAVQGASLSLRFLCPVISQGAQLRNIWKTNWPHYWRLERHHRTKYLIMTLCNYWRQKLIPLMLFR